MAASSCLRDTLKSATRAHHDALDKMLAPLACGTDYGSFLAVQYAARSPAEQWLARIETGPVPPLQCGLLADDLAALGWDSLPAQASFAPSDRCEAWGMAWALAGSSLGNRALLQRRRKAGQSGPERFLSDPAMTAFWGKFRPMIERPFDAATSIHAVRGAQRVFTAFLDSHAAHSQKQAA